MVILFILYLNSLCGGQFLCVFFFIAWGAKFEAEPVSMDIQAADPFSVGWAGETSKVENEQDNRGWAKFDDLTSISETSRYSALFKDKSGGALCVGRLITGRFVARSVL